MRSLLAGLLILTIGASATFAQVRGEVESVGFNGWFRPECWTPMIVRLDSQISEPAEYRIEVHQRDLDFDHVVYVKEGVTLNGHATQRWEVCFLPSPTNGGLPDARDGRTLQELQERLRVYLTNKEGTRQIVQLPVTQTVQSLDPGRSMLDRAVGRKLVLCVMDSSSQPAWKEYDGAIGLAEKPEILKVKPGDLPQSALAYQGVDAVVWIAGDARTLSEQGSKQLAAMQQWLAEGGMLVVCQPANDGERVRLDPLADMLPIRWKENGEWRVTNRPRDSLHPLDDLAQYRSLRDDGKRFWKLPGKFMFAHAEARPNAVVDPDQQIEWDADGKDTTPYIARTAYGMGCVTWVAQDLGNPTITGPRTSGWPYVWDAVLGWKNDTRIKPDTAKRDEDAYAETLGLGDSAVDVGSAMARGVEFTSKGAGLIVLAIFLFIIYWLVAGPGTYLFLATRKRKDLSWTAFGASAVVATLLTVVVVRLVLRGSPEIHHASDVRMAYGGGTAPRQPACVFSRIGLYIPRDGSQHVALTNTSAQFVSYLGPMPVYPPDLGDAEFPANLEYRVPVQEEGSPGEGPAIDVPFRSTLKKLQAKWCGEISTGVRGNNLKGGPAPDPRHWLSGSLDNLTGVDLRNVWVAYHAPGGEDIVLYIPTWGAKGAGSRIDLGRRVAVASSMPLGNVDPNAPRPGNGNDKDFLAEIRRQWSYYWLGRLSRGHPQDDLNDPVPVSFPVLSFFDRIPPARNSEEEQTKAISVLRHGGRNLNMSNALLGGDLVVLAQADNRPLPFPLEVNGDAVGGEGTVFYQFALPIDRVAPPPQQPEAPPATGRSGAGNPPPAPAARQP